MSRDADADDSVIEELTPVLAVDDAVVLGADGRRLLDDLSIVVYPGEIVGLAGVEGNGQRALADVLSSLVPLESGVGERRRVGGGDRQAGRARPTPASGSSRRTATTRGACST